MEHDVHDGSARAAHNLTDDARDASAEVIWLREVEGPRLKDRLGRPAEGCAAVAVADDAVELCEAILRGDEGFADALNLQRAEGQSSFICLARLDSSCSPKCNAHHGRARAVQSRLQPYVSWVSMMNPKPLSPAHM